MLLRCFLIHLSIIILRRYLYLPYFYLCLDPGLGGGCGSENLKIINKRRGLIKRRASENMINTNKWGWDGQLELAISKNKFVKRIVKTSTNHNNIFLKYAIKQSFQGKPIIKAKPII